MLEKLTTVAARLFPATTKRIQFGYLLPLLEAAVSTGNAEGLDRLLADNYSWFPEREYKRAWDNILVSAIKKDDLALFDISLRHIAAGNVNYGAMEWSSGYVNPLIAWATDAGSANIIKRLSEDPALELVTFPFAFHYRHLTSLWRHNEVNPIPPGLTERLAAELEWLAEDIRQEATRLRTQTPQPS